MPAPGKKCPAPLAGGTGQKEQQQMSNYIEQSNVARRTKGGRHPRAKGNRTERALVRFLQSRGFASERIPLSGGAGGSFVGDIAVPILGVDRTIEVKVRGAGFRQLYSWLEQRDLLIVRADRRTPLVVLPLALAVEIAAAAEGRR
jgi:hypothetical protein